VSQPERIFHIATQADWRTALDSGRYTTSTLGRSLAEEGFIHACRRNQVETVFDRFYRGTREHLVLLTIAPERLDAEIRDERVGDEVFPHVHGPLTPDAVVEARPLDRHGRPATFLSLFLGGMFVRMAAVVLVMLTGVLAVAAVSTVTTAPGAQLAALLCGLLVGALAVVLVVRRRRQPSR
jgi:uncharacterized protein (DUF952 family)